MVIKSRGNELTDVERIKPVFTRSETVHRSQLNMERNVYWTRFHSWFVDLLEEFLVFLAPDFKERLNAGELQMPTFDTYIKHELPAFLCDDIDITLEVGGVDPARSLIKILVNFKRGNDLIAEGWQRIRLIDGSGINLEIPRSIIEKAPVPDLSKDDLLTESRPNKLFEQTRKVYLHHTGRDGNAYPQIYLTWFGEVREAFVLTIAPDFIKRFASGMRILTHNTYLKNYEAAASFNDDVTISISVGEIKPASAKLLFTQTKEGQKLAEGWQTVVFANQEGKPIRIPPDILWRSKDYAVKELNFLKLLGKIKE